MKKTLQTNREQAERLAELGNQLRDRREKQEIPLEKVAGTTCIQPRLLRAIEQGKIEDLPEPVYIHSFIRQYADAIGLNGVEFASEFPTTGVMALPTIRTSWRALPGAQLRPMHLYLMYMVLIFGAVNGLSYFLNRSTQASVPVVELQQPAAPVAPLGPTLPAQQPANTKTISPAPASNKPVRVGVTVAEESWVRVMADDKVAFEGELPKGTQRTWTADRQVIVRAGNAGGVIVSYNESQAKPLGQPGEIQEIAFPPDPQMALR
ncbi:helix-turn-helix domain-containing protein [Leptolyngbya sp. AN03gr2]|uniref:helix-turn-helix domain-containing protein n=1 Tax=unclassified Leptolyngbya TaxID=2650499 RepID=UPI003D31C6E3